MQSISHLFAAVLLLLCATCHVTLGSAISHFGTAATRQCPPFAPCLSASSYKDYSFYRNDSTAPPQTQGYGGSEHLVGASRTDVAIECAVRGKEALVTPLYGHRALTTDDVSPLRRLSDYGVWRPSMVDTSDGTDEEYEEALLSGLLDADAAAAASASVGGGSASSSYVLQTIRGALLPVRYLLTSAASSYEGGVGVLRAVVEALMSLTRDSSAADSSNKGSGGEEEFEFIVDDGSMSGAGGFDRAAFTQRLDEFKGKAQQVSDAVVHPLMWRRIANTFFRHIPRLFGRVVTRIDYTLESNSNRQFIPTLKMFVVKPKRVLSGIGGGAYSPSSPASASSEEDREYISDEEAKAAASASSSSFAGSSGDSYRPEDHMSLPLSCEAWESTLSDRLLHSADAPEKDVFPDEATRRKQLIAKYRRLQAEGLVEEVCRPFRSGWLPPWLQAKFSSSGTESTTRLMSTSVFDACRESSPSDIGSGDTNIDGRAHDDQFAPRTGPNSEACRNAMEERTTLFRCEFSVPVASHSCLVVESLYRNKEVAVAISQSHVWDSALIGFVLTLVAIAVLKPILVTNKWLQIVAASALGIFFVLIVLVWLIVKDLRKTRLGQVGLVAMVTAGGILSFSETITSMLWYYLTVESRTNPYIQVALVGAAVGAALVSRFVFYDRVPTITHYSLSVVQVATWLALASHNREVAALVAALAFSSRFGFIATPLRLAKGIVGITKWTLFILLWPFIVLLTLVRFLLTAAGLVQKGDPFRSRADPLEAEPHESFPDKVFQAQAYVRPMVSEGIAGPTAEAKFRAYEAQGSEYTRKALRELGATIRSNPQMLGKLQDPNGVARYFGVSRGDDGNFAASDDE